MIVWLIIMLPICLLFTGLGIYAWRRKEPMWFWSGSHVEESEIKDIPAYNKANGMMWLAFSAIFWVSAFLGLFKKRISGVFLIVGTIVGVLLLPIVYGKIYQKYKK